MLQRPQRVTGSPQAWPLHDAAASRLTEMQAQALHPPHTLMARAGLAVARLALAMSPHARRVEIWAGPGNNGGDGLVAARHLHLAGRQVQVRLVADARRLPGDAAWALQQALAAGVAVEHLEGQCADESTAAKDEPDLHIDALLGLGAARAPQAALAAAIQTLNNSPAPVLAVDLPSGLHADTGMPLGGMAVRADATLALLTLKPGCHTGQGRDHAGTVWLDHLGAAATSPTAWLTGAPLRMSRHHASHKGSHGDVWIVGGAAGMGGAAWLSARAALAAGAGRVTCSPLDAEAALLDPAWPELMGRHRAWLLGDELLRSSTLVCGCGGGSVVAAVLPPLLAHAGRLVLDADALNAVAASSALLAMLRQRAQARLPTLLTPHPLEAARLLGCDAAVVQADRLAAAQRLAQHTAAAVLLKGSGSVIAAGGTLPCINPSGNAALATAGTGDVLAGWAGGLWAQLPSHSAHDIGCAAAWQHGAAADRFAIDAPGAPLRATALVQALQDLARQPGEPPSPA